MGKHEVKIHGMPVLGDSFDSAQDRHAIPAMAANYKVSQVIIAMPTAPGAEIRDILRTCGEAGVQARTLAPAQTRRCSTNKRSWKRRKGLAHDRLMYTVVRFGNVLRPGQKLFEELFLENESHFQSRAATALLFLQSGLDWPHAILASGFFCGSIALLI